MTWKEFKEQVEAQGVQEYMTVEEIVWDGSEKPEVRVAEHRQTFYIE